MSQRILYCQLKKNAEKCGSACPEFVRDVIREFEEMIVDKCVICFETLIDGYDEIEVMTPCFHKIHKTCFTQAMREKLMCPTCGFKITQSAAASTTANASAAAATAADG